MSKKDNYITVENLNKSIKELITSNLSDVIKIKGELSNLKISNGNSFFTLKDLNSAISIVAWNTMFDNLSNGDDVIVTGKLFCYVKQGTYNIQAYKAERIGIGNLHETYEKLKTDFQNQGLFSKKREFPKSINKIGIITSCEGAALQDILYVFNTKSFYGEVLLKNCFVQGNSCSQSIKNGIEYFNTIDNLDLILITRGGGSFEDLMGYSSEIVVNAIYDSDVFTISAVGPEVDNMLSDYVADYRAPTPSIAGEKISSAQNENNKIVSDFNNLLCSCKSKIDKKINMYEQKLEMSAKLLNMNNPANYFKSELEKLERTKNMIYGKIKGKIDNLIQTVEKNTIKLNSFDIISNFKKGFVVITDENNNIIKHSKDFINRKQKLKIIFVDGEVFI